MMAVRNAISVLGVVGVLLASGCNSSTEATLSGTVLVEGELASSGQVTLHPVKEGPTACGRIHRDGSYVVKIGQGNRDNPDASTIPPGDYVVTVVVLREPRPNEASQSGPPLPGDRWSDPIYADRDSTPLRVSVGAGRQLLPLDLKAAADAAAESDAAAGAAEAPPTEDEQPAAEGDPAEEQS